MPGRTIKVFLVNDDPKSILTAEIINWSGKVVVAPRTQLAELKRRVESGKTGVYFLVGPDPEDSFKERVYIGEGDSVIDRLIAHDKDERKDFFTRVAFVISKDENLTKAHGRYLESCLIELANKAERAVVTNGTAPATPPLPESDTADMQYVLEQIKLMLPVLGFTFLQPRPEAVHSQNTAGTADSPIFEMVKPAIGVRAQAQEVDGELIVLAGSTARKNGSPSWDSYRSQRDRLVEEGKFLASPDNPELYVLRENVAFASPSAAATILSAANANGRTEWRVQGTGQKYGDWSDARVNAAVPISSEQ